MFNLIPLSLRNKIKREYLFRKITLVFMFVICIEIVFFVLLFPTWLMSFYKEKEVTVRTAEMSQYLSMHDIASTTENIKSINSKISIIDKTLDYPKLVPIINSILEQKTNAISIDNLAYSVTDSKNATLSIQGKSVTRETLLAFVKGLQDSGVFKAVDLPISNFTKDKNLDFSIKITIGELKQ